jgi:hypothetical protein
LAAHLARRFSEFADFVMPIHFDLYGQVTLCYRVDSGHHCADTLHQMKRRQHRQQQAEHKRNRTDDQGRVSGIGQ